MNKVKSLLVAVAASAALWAAPVASATAAPVGAGQSFSGGANATDAAPLEMQRRVGGGVRVGGGGGGRVGIGAGRIGGGGRVAGGRIGGGGGFRRGGGGGGLGAAAVGLGVLGVMGAIAASEAARNAPPPQADCWLERRRVRDEYGQVIGVRNVRVCE